MTSKRKTKQLRWLVTMLLLVTAMAMPKMAWAQVTTNQPDNGDGTAANPYQITSAAELAWFRDFVNAGNETACARLEANIDMSTVCHPANESESVAELSWDPIGTFKGTFDGNNKTISNLYINNSNSRIGLFNTVSNSSIKNIIFEDVKITSNGNYISVLAGEVYKSDISNITVNSGTITGRLYVGGIGGEASESNISNCVNRIETVSTYQYVGGIVGILKRSSTITNCANYGIVTGREDVGGIVGQLDNSTLLNVLSSNDIKYNYASINIGHLVGHVIGVLTISGYVILNSDAMLYHYNNTGTKSSLPAFGKLDSGVTMTGETNIKALNKEQLKIGWGVWLLNGNSSKGAWGQQLGTDDYPQLGSAYTVYAEGNFTIPCNSNNTGDGNFTNTKPETEGTVREVHGKSIHYDAVDPTCTTEGNVEYWECGFCHHYFSDEAMTVEISKQITPISATGHVYNAYNETCSNNCGLSFPKLSEGEHTIQIEAVKADKNEIDGYNLYRFIAEGNIALTIQSEGTADTYGTLWNADGTTILAQNDNIGDNNNNFKLTYSVTKGTAYFIGVRQVNGSAIDGNYTINISCKQLPEGSGTAEDPYLINNAEDFAWFRDNVNSGNVEACARLEADIDMSTVCHAADESNGVAELSWEPISKDSNRWYGSFDGNNKTISNLYINTSTQYSGLFGSVGQSSVRSSIKDIILENINITSTNYYSGVLVGRVQNTDISGIKVNSGKITGKYKIGGVIGWAVDSKISDCVNRSEISGNDYFIGGIVGHSEKISSISNCTNYGNVENSSSNSYCGGIVGRASNSDYNPYSISDCANYGNIKGYNYVGGIVGNIESSNGSYYYTISNCANYGKVTGYDYVGGIAGELKRITLKNVFTSSDVTFTNTITRIGLVVGSVNSSTISGYTIYNSDAKLFNNNAEQTSKAIGSSYSMTVNNESYIKGLSTEHLKTGLGTWLLIKNSSTDAWGQQLGTDNYPTLDTSFKVYADGDICIGSGKIYGTFTNTQPEREGTVYEEHGNSIHHDAVDPTCTTEGNVEYWECGFCHHFFNDEALTTEIDDPVLYSRHVYNANNESCSACGFTFPILYEGKHTIQIAAVPAAKEHIGCYNLYRFVADGDGDLTVQTIGTADTYGTLWNTDGTAILAENDNISEEDTDFKLTYSVTKGTAYYIGVKNSDGSAIEGEYTINISGTWPPAGSGTKDAPYEIGNARQLCWFAGLVNGTLTDGTPQNTTAKGVLTDNIDLTGISNWTPIGNESNKFGGTFDGKNFKVQHLSITQQGSNTGLFGYASGATLQNICIDGNVTLTTTSSTEGYGSIAGCVQNSTISNCHSSVNFTINTEMDASVYCIGHIGGIVGKMYETSSTDSNVSGCSYSGTINLGNNKVNVAAGIVGYAIYSNVPITNCSFTGTIHSECEDALIMGGIFGYTRTGGNVKVTNCLQAGTLEKPGNSSLTGILIGQINTGYGANAVTNNYYTASTFNVIGSATGTPTTTPATQCTANQLLSGEICYLLNGSSPYGGWGQQLAEDDCPIPGSGYKVIKAAKGDNKTYWATFSNQSSDMDLSDLTVYTATVSEGILTLTQCTNKIVAMGEGVLVKGNSEYLNALMLNDDTETPEANNDLVATPTEPTVINATTDHVLYRLTYNDVANKTGLGFYLSLVKDENGIVDNTSLGKKLKVTPGKAYLKVAKSALGTAPIRGFVIGEDDNTTGIDVITINGIDINDSKVDDSVYDLMGRKVSKPAKGIYIKNGKKIIIK